MNRKEKPCEESSNYNYGDCINEQVMLYIGCQPYWFYKSGIPLPKCSNFSQYNSFLSEYQSMMKLDFDSLYKKFQCLKPCTFMEYKVLNSKLYV